MVKNIYKYRWPSEVVLGLSVLSKQYTGNGSSTPDKRAISSSAMACCVVGFADNRMFVELKGAAITFVAFQFMATLVGVSTLTRCFQAKCHQAWSHKMKEKPAKRERFSSWRGKELPAALHGAKGRRVAMILLHSVDTWMTHRLTWMKHVTGLHFAGNCVAGILVDRWLLVCTVCRTLPGLNKKAFWRKQKKPSEVLAYR